MTAPRAVRGERALAAALLVLLVVVAGLYASRRESAASPPPLFDFVVPLSNSVPGEWIESESEQEPGRLSRIRVASPPNHAPPLDEPVHVLFDVEEDAGPGAAAPGSRLAFDVNLFGLPRAPEPPYRGKVFVLTRIAPSVVEIRGERVPCYRVDGTMHDAVGGPIVQYLTDAIPAHGVLVREIRVQGRPIRFVARRWGTSPP